MRQTAQSRISLIDFAVAIAPLPGESVSGDRHIVLPIPQGVLVGVVDGLGHGPEAAKAATVAIDTLEAYGAESVVSLMKRCHEKLQSTRGAAISLASFNDRDNSLTWLSVGNVEGVLLRVGNLANQSDESVLLRGGVVGFNMPPRLQAVQLPISPGDLLVFATDGVRTGFSQDLPRTESLQRMADRICAGYGKGTDDALVLVTRYVGRSS